MSYFSILIKAYSIFFLHTLHLVLFVLFTLISDEWEDKYTPFGPKSSGVHPTNAQSVPLPIMGFKYVNSMPPIHYNSFRPKVGIIAQLVVSDLLIYPFSSKETTHT